MTALTVRITYHAIVHPKSLYHIIRPQPGSVLTLLKHLIPHNHLMYPGLPYTRVWKTRYLWAFLDDLSVQYFAALCPNFR